VRVIGVVDLLAGRAVHARAGQRESYRPVRAIAGSPIEPGDALALARAYTDRLGLTELYAADLDAILGRLRIQRDASASLAEAPRDDRPKAGRTSQDTIVAAVAALGAPLWLDAGVSSADQARHVLGLGAARVVVGLETLPSYDALGEICATLGGDRVAFSLDLRDGEPVMATGASGGISPGESAHLVAARAANAGVGAVIVIDLARVGTGAGLDLALIARVREAAPGLTLLAGGGVRGLEDLARLADSGCDGALVATALHDGRLGAAEVASAQRLGGPLSGGPSGGDPNAHSSARHRSPTR
jgi:phosphoribosylformimino-5-aminoimidazole carboxamide ribotide isomerase